MIAHYDNTEYIFYLLKLSMIQMFMCEHRISLVHPDESMTDCLQRLMKYPDPNMLVLWRDAEDHLTTMYEHLTGGKTT